MENHTTKLQETALLLLRLVLAAIFLYAGYAKLGFWSAAPAGVPAGMVILIKFLSIVEPLGALALVLGFLTRWAAAGLALIMAGAIVVLRFTMHAGLLTTSQATGLDYNLIILASCFVLMSFGAGRWSLDAVSKKA